MFFLFYFFTFLDTYIMCDTDIKARGKSFLEIFKNFSASGGIFSFHLKRMSGEDTLCGSYFFINRS